LTAGRKKLRQKETWQQSKFVTTGRDSGTVGGADKLKKVTLLLMIVIRKTLQLSKYLFGQHN
jgi:hypothetical protein